MLKVTPTGETLGATVEGLDLRQPMSNRTFATMLAALARYGVLRIPDQHIDAVQLKAFAALFGSLEINVANRFHEPGHPEVMILSNIVENGQPIGFADAGQDWHTDMSYSETIAFANVLHAVKVPQRGGKVLGNTEFANMYAAYEGLRDSLRKQLENMTVLHDFNKFWEAMRQRPGSSRPPLSEEQRRRKPPVSHPIFLAHPVTGQKVLYANPGYAVRINELSPAESDETLAFLFAHQLRPEYRYAHRWAENDVLIWDDICTLHNAWPDYGPNEHRLMKRCQVMADRIFEPEFAAQAKAQVPAI